MRGPDEATIIHRTLEQALAHDGAVVLADFLIITNTYPVSRRNGRLANVHDLTSPHVERVGRLHHDTIFLLRRFHIHKGNGWKNAEGAEKQNEKQDSYAGAIWQTL